MVPHQKHGPEGSKISNYLVVLNKPGPRTGVDRFQKIILTSLLLLILKALHALKISPIDSAPLKTLKLTLTEPIFKFCRAVFEQNTPQLKSEWKYIE